MKTRPRRRELWRTHFICRRIKSAKPVRNIEAARPKPALPDLPPRSSSGKKKTWISLRFEWFWSPNHSLRSFVEMPKMPLCCTVRDWKNPLFWNYFSIMGDVFPIVIPNRSTYVEFHKFHTSTLNSQHESTAFPSTLLRSTWLTSLFTHSLSRVIYNGRSAIIWFAESGSWLAGIYFS